MATQTPFDDFPLWQFSLERYGRPGVADLCLLLQDDHGLDVNIMLFCLWLGAEGCALEGEDDLRLLMEAARSWHKGVVVPVRSARRAWKDAERYLPAAYRQPRELIKNLELELEKIEQWLLYSASCQRVENSRRDRGHAPSRTLMSDNLLRYLSLENVPLARLKRELIDRLVALAH